METLHRRLLGWPLAALSLGGCATTGSPPPDDYAHFYRAESWATPSTIDAIREAPPTEAPEIAHVDRYDESVAELYAQQGYVLIGQSEFTSASPQSDKAAIRQGIRVGADLVIIVTPAQQRSGPAPGGMRTSGTTSSQPHPGSLATAYGALGPIAAYGASATTTYSADTPSAPATLPGSDYSAGYFVKMRYHFGVQSRDLTDVERRELKTDHGVYVGIVIDHSPADAAGILPGDVILAVDGHAAESQSGLAQLIESARGQTVGVTIVRAGEILNKEVSIRD
jgi:PDZ domain